jgi:hypothetical protein
MRVFNIYFCNWCNFRSLYCSANVIVSFKTLKHKKIKSHITHFEKNSCLQFRAHVTYFEKNCQKTNVKPKFQKIVFFDPID